MAYLEICNPQSKGRDLAITHNILLDTEMEEGVFMYKSKEPEILVTKIGTTMLTREAGM